MTRAITIRYEGEIVPFVRVGRERWTARATRYAASKDAIAWAVRAAVGGRVTGSEQAGRWAVSMAIKRRKARGDLDNVVKALLDSCQGVLWADDIQVVEIHATIERGAKADTMAMTATPMGAAR